MSRQQEYCINYVIRRSKKFTKVCKKNKERGLVLAAFRADPSHKHPIFRDAHFVTLPSLLTSNSTELIQTTQNYNPATHFVVWLLCENAQDDKALFSKVLTLPCVHYTDDDHHDPYKRERSASPHHHPGQTTTTTTVRHQRHRNSSPPGHQPQGYPGSLVSPPGSRGSEPTTTSSTSSLNNGVGRNKHHHHHQGNTNVHVNTPDDNWKADVDVTPSGEVVANLHIPTNTRRSPSPPSRPNNTPNPNDFPSQQEPGGQPEDEMASLHIHWRSRVNTLLNESNVDGTPTASGGPPSPIADLNRVLQHRPPPQSIHPPHLPPPPHAVGRSPSPPPRHHIVPPHPDDVNTNLANASKYFASAAELVAKAAQESGGATPPPSGPLPTGGVVGDLANRVKDLELKHIRLTELLRNQQQEEGIMAELLAKFDQLEALQHDNGNSSQMYQMTAELDGLREEIGQLQYLHNELRQMVSDQHMERGYQLQNMFDFMELFVTKMVGAPPGGPRSRSPSPVHASPFEAPTAHLSEMVSMMDRRLSLGQPPSSTDLFGPPTGAAGGSPYRARHQPPSAYYGGHHQAGNRSQDEQLRRDVLAKMDEIKQSLARTLQQPIPALAPSTSAAPIGGSVTPTRPTSASPLRSANEPNTSIMGESLITPTHPQNSSLAARVETLESKMKELQSTQNSDLNMRMEIMDLKTNVNKKIEEEVERRLRVHKKETDLKMQALEAQLNTLTKAVSAST
eukprot:TRINITY_DN61050_c0_g1_i1.p1 TRINITY_DN61050_c0_g1~~TRINITY_DN61050_c0_g1_i1.p1  ORF type:complete len:744 (+),score=84.66 TRINITY_DN61050_c0_g1_i1:33-2234(+)